MSTDLRTAALRHFNDQKNVHMQDLMRLVRIPSISFPGFDAAPVQQCADAVLDLLRACGLPDVRLLEAGSGHPSVFGQWTKAPKQPTLLLYAHYDVQPTGKAELWSSPPFEPTLRGGRLYGRGTSDDKAGAVMHAAALRSYLESSGSLPINVKVLIEGEEEVGSTNLGRILDRHRDLLAADAILIADSENFDSGHPSLTVSLRGIVTVSVEVRSLTSSVHSGTWGGPIPDPVIALAKMIASLVNDQGEPAIPGLLDRVRVLSDQDRRGLARLPYREATYRAQSHLSEGVRIIGGSGTVYEKRWYRPSVAVNAIEASGKKQASNIINDAAWARIGIRTVPDMDADETLSLLEAHLRKQAPWGVGVSIERETPSRWWRTETTGTALEAARAALEKGFGKPPAVVGAGGSIPFVQTMTEALGGVPALLFGVGDPYAAAHSENESLLIDDWEKATRSVIHLLAELEHRT